MAWLSQLVAAVADALKVDEPSVGLCARYLREAGLIRQHGRGPAAAQMGPTDATNLLLGVMVSGDVLVKAPKVVRHAREAHCIEIDSKTPPFPFLVQGGRLHRLGPALDALLDGMVRVVNLPDGAGGELIDLTFTVTRTRGGELAFEGEFELYGSGRDYERYEVKFLRLHPQVERAARSKKAWLRRMREVRRRTEAGGGGQGMFTMTMVDTDEFHAIADALRGYIPKTDEVVHPPYEAK